MPLEMKLLLKKPAPGTFGTGNRLISRAADRIEARAADRSCRRVDASGRHERVRRDHVPGQLAEIAGAHPRGRHRGRLRQRPLGPRRLVVAEEEERFLAIGPPSVPPTMFWLNGPFGRPARLLSQVLAFSASSRKNSKSDAAERVGPLLDRGVDHRARRPCRTPPSRCASAP